MLLSLWLSLSLQLTVPPLANPEVATLGRHDAAAPTTQLLMRACMQRVRASALRGMARAYHTLNTSAAQTILQVLRRPRHISLQPATVLFW